MEVVRLRSSKGEESFGGKKVGRGVALRDRESQRRMEKGIRAERANTVSTLLPSPCGGVGEHQAKCSRLIVIKQLVKVDHLDERSSAVIGVAFS